MNEAQPLRKTKIARTHNIASRAALAAGSVCILLASPTLAVELGEIRVDSKLGQPLRASIAYALGPNEQIAEHCVYLRAGLPNAAMPTISRASTTLRGNQIILRGDVPLREPMMAVQLAIDCPYTANIRRDYTVLLDLPGTVATAVATASEIQSTPAAIASRPNRTEVSARRTTPRNSTPQSATRNAPTTVVAGDRYQVMPGDTLSEIVSRIDNRQLNLWNSVDAIFSANPDAFTDQNMDRLIAGSVLIIPQQVTGAARTVTQSVASRPVNEATSTSRSYSGATESARTGPINEQESPVTAQDRPPVAAVVSAPAEAMQSVDESRTGSTPAATVAVEEAPAAAPVVGIPETRIVQRQPSPLPVVETANNESTRSWLVWLGGAGVAIFLGLLLFGRRFRDRVAASYGLDETQINEELHRRSSDRGETIETDELGLSEIGTPTDSRNLDGDLDDGRGFEDSDDIDVAMDYGFSSSGNYSDDISAGKLQQAAAEGKTEIMPPRPMTVQPAEDEHTGYNMSMVVDVTKQNFGSAATTRDLQAIQVEPLHPSSKSDNSLDLTTEFDHRVLEQDYQDEFSATQIQNMEIEKAARQLQKDLGQIDPDTNEISMAGDLEGTAEITAEMPGRALEDEPTAEMPAPNSGDELTAEMPARSADNEDDTAMNNSLTTRLPGRDADADADGVDLDLDIDETVQRRSKHG